MAAIIQPMLCVFFKSVNFLYFYSVFKNTETFCIFIQALIKIEKDKAKISSQGIIRNWLLNLHKPITANWKVLVRSDQRRKEWIQDAQWRDEETEV